MVPLSKIIIDRSTQKAVLQILQSGLLTQGQHVAQLEEGFCRLTQAKHAIAVSNGTTALHVALLALGIGPGDEVITTPFTFAATANSILMTGAQPVFVDVDPVTYNLDPEKVESAITSKTKALLVVDLYGQMADYTKLNKLAKKHKLLVIEDAAQSIGATHHGQPSGNIADATCFSLYATKNIMCGEGGMITTSNQKTADLCRSLRHHGQKSGRTYEYERLGYNFRLTDLHAVIGEHELAKIGTYNKRRNANAKMWNKLLTGFTGIITPSVAPNNTHVFHQYTIRVTPECPVSRSEFQALLAKHEIQSNIYYPHGLYEAPHLKADPKNFPVTQELTSQVLSLPVHPHISQTDKKHLKTSLIAIKKQIYG